MRICESCKRPILGMAEAQEIMGQAYFLVLADQEFIEHLKGVKKSDNTKW